MLDADCSIREEVMGFSEQVRVIQPNIERDEYLSALAAILSSVFRVLISNHYLSILQTVQKTSTRAASSSEEEGNVTRLPPSPPQSSSADCPPGVQYRPLRRRRCRVHAGCGSATRCSCRPSTRGSSGATRRPVCRSSRSPFRIRASKGRSGS